ncbi:MAG: MvaI/BcnI family restriction endonuclease [Anaerolineae bacterium]
MQVYTKDDLIKKLRELGKLGWVVNGRFGNHGGVGNTLEDYLGITENNLPIPNAAEWELKTQRANTSSLTTLIHTEPSPRAIRFVPKVLLPFYGWKHKEAGKKYPETEMSFRQTIHGLSTSDRGFMVKIDRSEKKVLISFDSSKVDIKHRTWLSEVETRVGLKELDPQPYWGFDDLEHAAGTKLLNCFYVQAQVKREQGNEYYWYNKVLMLEKFKFEGLLEALESGVMLVDFDARSGHNHGTKLRLRQNHLPLLYEKVTTIMPE